MAAINLPLDSRWTILQKGEDYVYPKSGNNSIRYICKCNCGKIKLVHASHLKNGSSKSCGCLNVEISSTLGGLSVKYKREYASWTAMKSRCLNPNKSEKNSKYENISVCKEWLESFISFINDMGPCPDKFELERVDPSTGYFPSNCTWASETRQAQNKGDYKNNTSGQKRCCLERVAF